MKKHLNYMYYYIEQKMAPHVIQVQEVFYMDLRTPIYDALDSIYSLTWH
jgi:hypothetical protein